MKHTPRLPLPLACPIICLALLASGCAGDTTRYPSLLPRAIERRGDAEPEAPPPVAAAPDPALDKQLADLGATVDAAARGFAAAAKDADRQARAAKGDPVGGERWITAQTALAGLDGFRAQTAGALADLEQLEIARGTEGLPGYPALETVRAAADARLAEQTARIAAIQALLPEAPAG